ncbi:GNAT family N-acetyltransferase [Quadrisphaera sp. KR29]|uniref:GNAT family N-acetyltransferase n=1 Tax=Quadrisphaera sp. KR29 TaxID=3461391 RepID=UPI00404456D0
MSSSAPPGGPAEPVLRRATAEDLPALRVLDGRAFGATWEDADFTAMSGVIEPGRFVVAVEPGADGPDALVGGAGSYAFTMTVPGGARLEVPGVTWVAVALHQRRRGLLRRMLADLHAGLVEQGAPLALLTASEATIYGRFGYGAATTDRSVRVDRRRARLTPAAEALAGPHAARHATVQAARAHLAEVHERWCGLVPGALSRSGAWWDWLLADTPGHRSGGTELFVLVHPDGYATYRAFDDGSTARVVDLCATTPAAHASLWRSLLALDLVEDVVSTRAVPLDDALPHLLTDPRAVTTTGLEDGAWARLLDVPAALAARRYAAEVDVVLEVVDDGGLGGVDASARVRLRGGPDGAQCTRTGAAADATLGVAALSAAYLGGTRLAPLARAGLVRADDPAVLARLSAALLGPREPQHGTSF